MNPDIPVPTEADYLDAAQANVTALFTSPRDVLPPEEFDRTVANYAALPSHRAAVDSAYAAGWRAGHAAGYDEGRDDGEGGAYTAYAHPGQATADPPEYRRVQTPRGERIAYFRPGDELPAGFTDLGPYGPEVPSGLSHSSDPTSPERRTP